MAESLHEICKDLSECTCRDQKGREAFSLRGVAL